MSVYITLQEFVTKNFKTYKNIAIHEVRIVKKSPDAIKNFISLAKKYSYHDEETEHCGRDERRQRNAREGESRSAEDR